jgi:PKD domain
MSMMIRRSLMVLCLIQSLGALSGCGGGGTATQQQPPPPASVPPTAAFVAPATANVLDAVALDASTSTSGDGSALQYLWDFGSGVHGGGVKIAHVFATAGDSTVKLTVVDGAGRLATTTKTISIAASSVASTPVTTQVQVLDVNGVPLAGVTAAGSAASDSTGKMTVSLNAGASTLLKFSKSDYSDQFLQIDTPTGSGTDGYVQLTMRTRDAALSLSDASAGGTLTGRDGATITVPANAFLDASGAAVTGAVQIAVTPIDVTQPNAGGFPGSFEGVQMDGTKTPIVSAGVNEFVPTANGAPIQLAPGKAAGITIPIYAATKLDGTVLAIGDAIPLWSLDEATGIWIQEGTGTIAASTDSPSGLVLQATVSHLSWWNTDMGFYPYGPSPQCVYLGDSSIPGATDYFASASICNMLASIDQGLGDSGSAAARSARIHATVRQLNPPTAEPAVPDLSHIMEFSRWYTVPIAGGVAVPVPSDLNVRLSAYALNGTWVGSVVVKGAAFTGAPVTIAMHPTTQASTTPEAITLPFDDVRSVAAATTAQFTFSATKAGVARITLTQAQGSDFSGMLRLLQGASVLGTDEVEPGKVAQVAVYLPAAGTYTIAADIDRMAAFRLQANLEPSDAQVQPITLPFNAERSLLPQPTATYSFSATADQFARIIVSVPTDGTGGNQALSGQIRLLQGTTVVASMALSGASTQLLVNLSAAGTYTIEISGTAGATFHLGADLEGSTQSETLSVPSDITRSMVVDGVYRGSFTLTAATTLYFNSRHVTGDLTDVKLLAADGSVLFDAPPGSAETDATNSIVATLQPGTYTVLVVPQNAGPATERLSLATTSWVPVAPTLAVKGTSEGQTVDLIMDRNGKPVVGFVKIVAAGTGTGNAHILQLRRWSGTQWEVVGADIQLNNPCELTDGVAFAFDSANNPVVVYASTATDNSTAFSAHRFSAGAWAAIGANGGQLPNTASSPFVCTRPTTLVVGADNQPVVAYMTDSGPVLQHFDGTSWVGYASAPGDSFGDGASYFEIRFDPSGKLWRVYSSGVSIPAGKTERFNSSSNAWESIGGGTFPQVNTSGLEEPRLRFDSAGSPVVAWLAAVGADQTQGVAVYRFDGTSWNTTGGHVADGTILGPNHPNPAFVLFNNQAVLAWDNQLQSQSFGTVVVQTNTASGWTAVNGGVGELPQYSQMGGSVSIAQNAHLASDGTDIYMTVVARPDGESTGADGALTLLKKVGP